jgi:ATP-dependent RNA helicase DeaD
MVEVKRYLPSNLVGSFMFSATFPQSVLRLAEEFMHEPELINLSSDEENITSIAHQFVEVQAMGKERKLIKFIELENPSSALIFCNTKRNVEFTAALLSQFGFDAEGLTSDLTQNKREKLMAQVKAGKLRFLVATDVAARGIDIPELSHVFMMEPPEDPESYVHRAGRTGRAGASGTAITMVDVIQKMELERIATRFNIKFQEIKDPTEEDVSAIIEERLTALLEKKHRKLTNIQKERVSRFLPLAKKYAKDEEALALLAMLLDEIYQPTLHGKPVEPAAKPAPTKQGRPTQQRSESHPPRSGSRTHQGGKQSSRPEKHDRNNDRSKTAPKQENREQAPQKTAPKPESKEQISRDAAPKSTTANDSKPRPRPRRRRRKRKPSSS